MEADDCTMTEDPSGDSATQVVSKLQSQCCEQCGLMRARASRINANIHL